MHKHGMKELTEIEMQRAFAIWDYHFKTYWASEGELPLKKARLALQLPGHVIAKKMGISPATYTNYEKSEMAGTLSLKNLKRAADALDCELVYTIQPKNKKTFSQLVWEMLLPTALSHPWLNACDPRRRGEALAGLIKRQIENPKFRQSQAWSRRKNLS